MQEKIKQFECNGLFCTGNIKSRCMIAAQMKHQAKNGSLHPAGPDVWPKDNWNAYKSRTKEVLPYCAHPEQLQEALDTNPIFAEDLKIS